MKKKSELETRINESIGEASVCWESLKLAGEFDSTRAANIAISLQKYIEETTLPRPNNLIGKWLYWLRSAVYGILIYTPHYFFNAFMVWSALALVWPDRVTYWQAFGLYWLIRIINYSVLKLSPNLAHEATDEHEKKTLTFQERLKQKYNERENKSN